MKKQIYLLIAAAVWTMSCSSTPNNSVVEGREMSGNNTSIFSDVDSISLSNFSDAVGKELKLVGVYINGTNTGFNRNSSDNERFTEIYTLILDAGNVSGVGAPNRYSAPYTLGSNQSISIMLIRSTMMAALFEPENITEHDFFTYMQNAYEWRLVNNNLELYSKTADGKDVRLVFSL